MQRNEWHFDWRKFRSTELFAVQVTILLSLLHWVRPDSDNLFRLAGGQFVVLSGLAFLLAARTKVGETRENALRDYMSLKVGSLIAALMVAAFTLLPVLEHQNHLMRLQSWLVLAFVPLPWVFAVAGYIALKWAISGPALSVKDQERILRVAVKWSTITLLFVCAIICGFARILSFYLK
jgi:cytochrome bd-type quinol oxidase subunit 1